MKLTFNHVTEHTTHQKPPLRLLKPSDLPPHTHAIFHPPPTV